MKLAIIGSRSFNDLNLLTEILNSMLDKITLVVSGGAIGADKMGENWANANNIPTLIFLPDWKTHKKMAGFIRNEDIIKNCDEVIAFWDGSSRGTQHSMNLAKQYEKPCSVIKFTPKITSPVIKTKLTLEDIRAANQMSHYRDKKINPDYFEKIILSGDSREIPTLTAEEFNNGKAGYVWMDNKTGKLIFNKPESNE